MCLTQFFSAFLFFAESFAAFHLDSTSHRETTPESHPQCLRHHRQSVNKGAPTPEEAASTMLSQP
jgi:hypothetical protein